jgi:hypothetical protein
VRLVEALLYYYGHMVVRLVEALLYY